MSPAPLDLEAAYRWCERLTRDRARNFYYGIRLLPAPKRRALCAIYAFARRVDDAADDPLEPQEKLRRLERARADLAALGAHRDDPALVALADATARYALPVPALEEIIDGAEMDVRGTTYQTFEDLLVYCRRVAGSVGRLSVAAFGASDPERAAELADSLGVAMQLTNILRDLTEDRREGRLYLPREDLDRFGVDESLSGSQDSLEGLISFEAARARRWFGEGLRLLPMLDRRSAACVATMSGIYRRILDGIQRDPSAVLRARLALPAWEKVLVAARSLAGKAR